jgi:paired amphipathic helix protein Sin3a
VIERISTLFAGYPALIQGFNTFVPVGYRIECTLTSAGEARITVSTPMGTTTQTSTVVSPTAMSMPALMAKAIENEHQDMATNAPPAQAQVPPYTIESALEFLQMLKHRYTDEIYHQFLDLLQSGTRDVGTPM